MIDGTFNCFIQFFSAGGKQTDQDVLVQAGLGDLLSSSDVTD